MDISTAAFLLTMLRRSASKHHRLLWLKSAILLLMFALLLTSIRDKSPTFDEQGYLTRGVGYLRGENKHMRVGHPLGLNALNGMLLAADEQVQLPVDDPAWLKSSFHRPSEQFMWEMGNDVERIMFLGRLPTIWVGLLLAALVGRWAWEISHRHLAGVLALILLAFDPNILAHARLATTDLGLAAAALLAGYLLWRFWRRPSWGRAILAGVGFGLLQNTKFTAGLFIPIFALFILVAFFDRWRKARATGPQSGPRTLPWRPLLMLVICYPLAAFLLLWASYGFQIGTLPDNLPILPQLSGLTLPLSHHLEQLLDIGGRLQKATPSFLLGQYSDKGWWYYFPVTFFLKTSLPVLIMLLWATVRFILCLLRPSTKIARLPLLDAAALLIPPLGYFAFALTTDINLGYRHLLPVLPFVYVFIAVMLSSVRVRLPDARRVISRPGFALAALMGLVVVITFWIHPHYLAFFNVAAGGPDGGWRYLVDSNLDWGQDLMGLKGWMDENEIDQIWLSYFGEARPEYYGIDYTGIDSFPPRLMNPEAQPFFPHDPAPGTYAISATTLQGVHFSDHDQFAWFRDLDPVDKIGYSIFIYDVPARGLPVDIALSDLQLNEIEPKDFDLWSTNVVTAHWFDAGQSLLLPQPGQSWLALRQNSAVHPSVAEEIASWEKVRDTDGYHLYQIPDFEGADPLPLVTFSSESGPIRLIQAEWDAQSVSTGEIFSLETRWLKQAPPTPVKIFIHIVDDAGNIVAQWDGLGAAWEGWREQDVLLQYHQIQFPDTMPAGAHQIWVGLYDPDSGQRWPIDTPNDNLADGDNRFLLGELNIDRP